MNRIRCLVAIGAAVVMAGMTASALACFGDIIEVAQPLVDPEGIRVRVVSLSRNCVPTLVVPGYEVEFVAHPSCVHHEGAPDTCENLNAAGFLGIHTGIDPYHARTSQLLGDTLHVIMDLTDLPPMSEDIGRQLLGWTVDDVVKATVTSILLTAYWHRRGISPPDSLGQSQLVYAEHVWLEVQGADQYVPLGGVFNLTYLDSLSRSHW